MEHKRGKLLIRIEKVDENNFKSIPSPCRYCLYWQTSAEFNNAMLKPEMEQKKREWFNRINKEFEGSLKIVYIDDVPIGFIQLASAKFFPRVNEYICGPPSNDAVFLACLYISRKEMHGKGFGTTMLKDLLAELRKRGFKTVETFARKSSADNPSGPLNFYLKQGFKIKADDDFPLLRLEL
jgi:GNAT superfamily N-acetyltransferase